MKTMDKNPPDLTVKYAPAPFEFKTTRGLEFRVARWSQDRAWIRFFRSEAGKAITHPEPLPPAPWPHSDQAAYLAFTLRERGHNITDKTVREIRAYLYPQT